MSDFYNKTGAPSNKAPITSPDIRAEFAAIEAADNKLPALTGHANEYWVVNSGGTAATTQTAATVLSTIGAQATSGKDASGGYAGLTLFKINFKNAANTFTNFFTNATTAQRTYTFQDRDGTIADNTDLATKQNSLGFTAENSANKDATGGYAGLTAFKINFKNVANTFTSFFTNSNTAARTYTFPDKDGTVVFTNDAATESVSGIAKVATQAIVNAGTNDTDFLTSLKNIARPGQIIQSVYITQAEANTGGIVMPFDNTPPQNNEGDQYMSITMTPLRSSSRLRIKVNYFATSNTNMRWITAALFRDATLSAIGAAATFEATALGSRMQSFTVDTPANATASTTFKLRIGGDQPLEQLTFNGQNGVRILGAVLSSSMEVTEISQ